MLFLILLLSADLVFIALHVLWELTDIVNDSVYALDEDRGYAEIYQYVKWFSVIMLLTYLIAVRRSMNYISWLFVFLYFLCDDAFTIHESVGSRLAETLSLTPPFGLRLKDIGELVVSTIAGIILLTVLGWAYVHGTNEFKIASRLLLLLIVALVFFGIGLDMFAMSTFGSDLELILIIGEDGGEMLVASFILSYVSWLCRRDPRAT
jgi:hypothetical protein